MSAIAFICDILQTVNCNWCTNTLHMKNCTYKCKTQHNSLQALNNQTHRYWYPEQEIVYNYYLLLRDLFVGYNVSQEGSGWNRNDSTISMLAGVSVLLTVSVKRLMYQYTFLLIQVHHLVLTTWYSLAKITIHTHIHMLCLTVFSCVRPVFTIISEWFYKGTQISC